MLLGPRSSDDEKTTPDAGDGIELNEKKRTFIVIVIDIQSVIIMILLLAFILSTWTVDALPSFDCTLSADSDGRPGRWRYIVRDSEVTEQLQRHSYVQIIQILSIRVCTVYHRVSKMSKEV